MGREQLTRTLQIDPDVEAVEVKITARIADEDEVRAALQESGEDPEKRRVFFFDTPGLQLFDAGVVLRARDIKGGADDSTVKLRPVDPDTVSVDWKKTSGFTIELDVVGDDMICSAKLDYDLDGGRVAEVADGERAIKSLFGDVQERLIADFAPRGSIGTTSPCSGRSTSASGRSTSRVPARRRGRGVDAPRQVGPDRAVDQGRTRRRGDGYGRFPRLPARPRVRHRGRPADQDPGGAAVLHHGNRVRQPMPVSRDRELARADGRYAAPCASPSR
jgi:hypothetical protein